jgi:hypothetical protein
MKRRLIALVAASLALVGLAAGTAAATGKPVLERFDVDRTVLDEGLTQACGVEVTSHIQGHVVFRTFPDGTGPAELVTLNLTITAMAGDNSYTFKSVGADLTRIEPDGTAILMSTGQFPFEFNGVIKINLNTGDVILEPHNSFEDRLADACAALTA